MSVGIIKKVLSLTKKDLVWFYGISTIIDYLMPNPFLYI